MTKDRGHLREQRYGGADKLFAGKTPEIYDRFLVPLILESYAGDLAERVAKVKPRDVLETSADPPPTF